MAAVGAGFPWLLSAGPVSISIVVLLAVFLAALCIDCTRRSFELQDTQADKNPSTLIRVVKLEEVHENPTITEILSDEKEFHHKEVTSSSPTQSHQGAPETLPDSLPGEDPSVGFPPWRSHLMAPQSNGMDGPSPLDSAHIYQTIGGGWGNSSDTPSLPANQKPAQLQDEEDGAAWTESSVYARVSKKPGPTPGGRSAVEGEESAMEGEESAGEGEESAGEGEGSPLEGEESPPLPDRKRRRCIMNYRKRRRDDQRRRILSTNQGAESDPGESNFD